jgi:hypothetical protein
VDKPWKGDRDQAGLLLTAGIANSNFAFFTGTMISHKDDLFAEDSL